MIDESYYLGRTLAVYTDKQGPIFIGKLAETDTENRRIILQPSTAESWDPASNVTSKAYATSQRFMEAMEGDVRSEIQFDRISGFSDITSLLKE